MEPKPDDSTEKRESERTLIVPYDGHVTLDLNEWRSVASTLRNFLINMQMNIRDINSKDYAEMRDCELDTKVWTTFLGILCDN